eukprot:TRINITY_DN1778_c0_g1_i7.p1 TRINITY_DN1778_c0_g1~~TRINITY_DN1778_c0_g1_i7.p1  ORF type:complete len:117 (+),score=19.08 TRINITY_DN1778_c0_g1_i7:76-426(+)
MAEEVTANSPMTKVVNRWKTASPILFLLESTETNFSQHFGAPSGDRCLQILISKSFELLDSPQTKDYAARDALNFLISEVKSYIQSWRIVFHIRFNTFPCFMERQKKNICSILPVD